MGNQRACSDKRCLFHTDASSCAEKDFSVLTTQTREGEGLWERCNHCGLAVNRLGVVPEESEQYYNEVYILNHAFPAGELFQARQHFEERIKSLARIATYLEPHLTPSMRVLDLGAGTGEVLSLLKNKVAYCMGIELHKTYAAFIKQELNVDASYQDYLTIEFERPFDLILSIDALDHMYNEYDVVQKIWNDLSPGGLCYIEVPNDEQALKQYIPTETRACFQKFMYQRAHYYSFNKSQVGRLFTQFGFEIVDEQCRHDYTFLNYLQWYFLGKPQKHLATAMNSSDIHSGSSPFEHAMNTLLAETDEKFRQIMSEQFTGETLCLLVRKPL